MTEPSDLIEEYLQLFFGGAKNTDARFDLLLASMTPEQVQETQQLVADIFRRQLAPEDFVDLSLALVAHGARPDDLRLVTLLAVMSPDELERGKQALGELWLQREPVPPKAN